MIDIASIKNFNLTFRAVLQSLEMMREEVDSDQLAAFVKVLVDAFHSDRKVFVYGTGRSLLVGKAFSMRLMHLGFKSYVIGETVTPAVSADDVFLVISKTLTHEPISTVIDDAERLKARIIVLTSGNGSALKKASDLIVIPDLKSSTIKIRGTHVPLGTLFEISAMALLDCVVPELMSRLGVTEEEMVKRHANIE